MYQKANIFSSQAVDDETNLVTAMIFTEIRRLASGGRETVISTDTAALTETLELHRLLGL
jgi:hypothetical protein